MLEQIFGNFLRKTQAKTKKNLILNKIQKAIAKNAITAKKNNPHKSSKFYKKIYIYFF